MKRLSSSLIILFVSAMSYALPIDEESAMNIASAFFADLPTRAIAHDVRLVWAGRKFPVGIQDVRSSHSSDNAYLYVYNRGTSDGFVVVSGETGMPSVLAFSHERSFDFNNMSPGTQALMHGWCRQIQAVREGKFATAGYISQTSDKEGNVVRKYETPLWGQGKPFNLEAPVFADVQCVTGCVATAISILAYYHKYPISGTGTVPEYTYDGVTIPEQKLGRAYDYGRMLSDYTNGYTEEQGMAVAALMKDVGIAVKMMYGVNLSAAFDREVLPALITHFGYSKNAFMGYAEGYGMDEWTSVLKQNLDEFGPTSYRGTGASGGHAFVLDGYTDSGYFSINYGWGGANNGYYLLPGIEFYDDQAALLHLIPDPHGISSYRDNLVIVGSYDEETEDGVETFRGLQAMSDSYETGIPSLVKLSCLMNNSLAPFNGKVKISLCNAEGEIKEDLVESDVENLAYFNSRYFKSPIEITITKEINVGDRLRVFYRGEYSDQWQLAKVYSDDLYYEAVIMAAPEQVAGSLNLSWSKTSRTMSLGSSFPIQCHIEGEGHSAFVSTRPYKMTDMSLAEFPKGKYLLRVSAGSDPYEVEIIL